MLYKNDEPFKITEAIKSKFMLKHSLRGFPIRIKFPEEIYKYNPNNPERLDRPSTCIIPYEEVINTENGSEKWNYCVTPPRKQANGELEYYKTDSPALFMSGSIEIAENKIDLAYFLLEISMRNGDKQVSRPAFIVDNPKKEAQKALVSEGLRIKVEGLVLAEDRKLPFDEIVHAAKAFGMSIGENPDEEVVRLELLHAITTREKSKKDGYSTFLDLFSDDEKMERLATIQEAKDKGIVRFDKQSFFWYITTKTGKKIAQIGSLVGGRDADESLLFHLTSSNIEMMNRIREAISQAKKADEEEKIAKAEKDKAKA